ncbi:MULTISPECIES: MFS transporter [unclassified Streptomyces]|uniref:MFS transporter n=1 Tax=unclassified Streptomyces TaxID=2593676 RepID=UPI00224EA345|nr:MULTISPECIES: MFS transporter [unclassified Streptomyces]MCX4649273.1 MFS transporter [Streptomyces sp. NBC_01446]MCX5321516.1 MFS transporter [Streptomyces sp. NBC_00120]
MTAEDQTAAHTTTTAADQAGGGSTRSAPPGRAASAGRWPATAVFFLNGLTLSTYIVRLGSLKDKHHLSDGQLGLIGMVFAVAALACMQGVGLLTARVGTRPVLRTSLLVMPVLLALVGLVGGAVELVVVVTALGAVHGTTDAAMNTHAVAIERRLGRPILNGCHAAWSVSAVVASLATAVLERAGISFATHLVAAAAVLMAGGLLLGPLLVETGTGDRARASAPEPRRLGLRGGWSREVVALGLTGTALMVCEGAALGWSAIFLHDSRGASLGLAATAVTAYTGAQAVGRVIGDRLTLRYGAPVLFRAGGLVAACGLAMALLSPNPVAAIGGFAVAGAGASVLIPLAYSAVGQAKADSPEAATLISRFTTFTYAGTLFGPAAIGWAAELAGLTWTLTALIPVLCAVALLSRLPGRPQH